MAHRPAALTALLETGPEIFTWGDRLIAGASTPAPLSISRGCENRSIAAGYSYAQFRVDTARRAGTVRSMQQHPGILSVLLQRTAPRNRHLQVCAAAVLMALQIWRLDLLHAVNQHASSNTELWNKGLRELNIIGELHAALSCADCNEAGHAIFLMAASAGWAINGWARDEWKGSWDSFNARAGQQEHINKIIWDAYGFKAANETHHFRLFTVGQALLERLRREGLLHSWVVARSSMIFSMRYGYTRGTKMPSGRIDVPRGPPYDMEAYVLTDSWELVAEKLFMYAEEVGFLWCGWQQGWPEQSAFCVMPGAEFEFQAVAPKLVPHMLPTSRCLVRPPPWDPGFPAAAGGGLAAPGALDLPCPGDPIGFMRQIWSIQKDEVRERLLGCFPLPTASGGAIPELSEEDVRFLWRQAKQLHRAGYASMVRYFASCRGPHPHAALAAALGADWNDTRPGA